MGILVTSRKDRLLHFFLENTTQEVHLRQLSRIVNISFPWVRKLVAELVHEKLLHQQKKHGLVLVQANRDNPLFLSLKRCSNLFALYQSGFVGRLAEVYHHPEAIILFGSYSRGEDTEYSDIDIAVISKRSAQISSLPYEKILKRNIKIKELSKEKISKDFLATLANGITLSGYLEIA